MSRSNRTSVGSFPVRDPSWTELFDSPCPTRIGAELRAAIIRHGEQEQRVKSTFRQLERRLQTFVAASDRKATTASIGPVGSRLIRSWRGVTHEVVVMDKGFAYRTKVYRSLSEIARVITGARWSGPRFFAVKDVT